MIRGKKGSLKKEKEITKNPDVCVERGTVLLPSQQSLPLGTVAPKSLQPSCCWSWDQHPPAPSLCSKHADLVSCTVSTDPDAEDQSGLIGGLRAAWRRGCSLQRREVDVVTAERDARVAKGTRRFEPLSIWQERGA